MPRKSDFIPNFEIRSVMLLAALTLGCGLATTGQPSPNRAPSAQNTTRGTRLLSPTVGATLGRADAHQDDPLSPARPPAS